ncbi:enoyl-CoA hydratase/isomerase family protein [Ferruginivarius sediminum]|uniref:enoyl-CoA hydratase/isomerase family protein n=1 Tax=Ferruginivarius sediminum TaxID=2661937 RepID=UPI001F4E0023|nr:enoyl-CoA hydratase/isomerase family protein [Ferruginivarius sediminum]
MSEATTEAVRDLGGTEEIRFQRRGGLGEVEMTRPKALNALTLDMIRHFDPLLRDWARDPAVQAVVIRGAGEKAFCAGGDVRAVWDAGKAGDDLTAVFFREEYTLNRRIHAYPKPYIALIDGITMGGGVGLSVHGSHRIAGDRTMVAMPETAIGFFPDVGATWVLPRLEGQTGMYMALTGARLKTADAVHAGFATHYVPSERGDELNDALAAASWSGDPKAVVDGVLADFAADPGPAPLAEQRAAIDRCFGRNSVEDILRALEAEGGDWAAKTLETLGQRSPTSLKLTFAALRRGAEMDFDDCMRMEYRLSQACMAGHEFYEGIRAVLVEKDHAPKWRPATLAEVDDAEIERAFAPLGERDLAFVDD